MYDISVSCAFILSAAAILLMATLIDSKLRSRPTMWFLYQLLPLSMLIGFIMHPLTYFGTIFESEGICYFTMYTAEYVFFGVSLQIVVLNIEVFFTKVFPLPRWQSHSLYRFVIMTLSTWLVSSMLVALIVIDNNSAQKNSKYFFCLLLTDEKVRLLRVLFREMFPAILSCLIGTACIVIYVMKKSRMSQRYNGGQLREVRVEDSGDEIEWIRCLVYIDLVWLVRAVCLYVTHNITYTMTSSQFLAVGFLFFIHVLCLYLVPFSMLFIADVRRTLKCMLFKILQVVSFGRLEFGDDGDGLAISFGNINATTEDT